MMTNSALLKDLLVLTKDGEWGKGEPADDMVEMFVIRGTDFAAVRYGDLSGVPIRFISNQIAERKRLEPNDILIETAGGTKDQPTGRTTFLKPRLFEQSAHPITCASFSRFLRVNNTLAVAEYIFWYLQFLYHTGVLEQHQVQHTGIARFQYTKFAQSVEIPLPPLSEQKAIAHILGTLDDKIELNQQMNRNLEAIASALFKSWFVDFDPVRAKMEGRQPVGMDAATAALFPDLFEDSLQGEIPKGWMLGSLANICVFQGGFAYKSKDFIQEGEYPVIKIKNIREDGTVDIDDIQYIPNQIAHKTSDYWLKNGELVMAMTGATVGKFALILNQQLPSLLNQRVARISPLKKYGEFVWFVYCALLKTDVVDQIISIADGSAQPNISVSGIGSVRLVVPPDSLINEFNQKVNALFDKILSNRVESRTLTTIRDTLLPKLMSGEIRVKEAEKIVEAVA